MSIKVSDHERARRATSANGHGMQPMAARLQAHHTRPAPEASAPHPDPFPAILWAGLWAGMILGAVLGLAFAQLLFRGVVAPQGWEAAYALGPFTFHVLWTMLGLAGGLFVGGLWGIFAARSPR